MTQVIIASEKQRKKQMNKQTNIVTQVLIASEKRTGESPIPEAVSKSTVINFQPFL